MVGNVFFDKLVNKFQERQNQNLLVRKAGKHSFYLMDCYNVKPFLQKDEDIPAIGQIVNAANEALNTSDRLPKYVTVIIDKDTIEELDSFEYGSHKAMEMDIDYIVKRINVNIKRKRMQILEKKPGAVFGEDPTIIFITMLMQVEWLKSVH